MDSFRNLAVIVFVFSTLDKAFSKGGLEISYDRLPEGVYHANNSNAIYSPESTHVTIGCMLPASASAAEQDAERNQLLWKKEGTTDLICAELEKDSCDWQDPSQTRPRGTKQLHFLLVATEDNFKQGFGGSGAYTCYHSKDYYYPAQVNVWVAGSLLEIVVNGSKLIDRTYELPEKTVSEFDRKSLILDCTVTAGAKGLVADRIFAWYRNEQLVRPSSRFVFHDSHNKRLEIKNAGSGDGGVYMCEADFEQQNGTPIKSRQYVVLKGDQASTAAAHGWRYQFSTIVLLFLVRVAVF